MYSYTRANTASMLIACICAGSTCAAIGQEHAAFFPESFVLDSGSQSEPAVFQYHWRLVVRSANGVDFERRVVVERNGPLHAVLVLTADGFPLAHFLDNIVLCVSQNDIHEVSLYTGAGFRFFFGLDESGGLGFTGQSVVPADGSRSLCDIAGLLNRLRSGSPSMMPMAYGRLLKIDKGDGKVCIVEKKEAGDRSVAPISSISVRSGDVAMDIFGIHTSTSPPLSITRFAPEAKQLQRLEGRGRHLTRGDEYPAELRQLCASLSLADDNARRVSDQFHVRFARNEMAAQALANRARFQELLGIDAEAPPPKLHLATLSKLLNETLHPPSEREQPFRERLSSVKDPYRRLWFTEACLGPRIANTVRAKLFEASDDAKQPSLNRLLALAMLCETGWTPRENADFVRIANALGTELPDLIKAMKQFGTDWELVEARASSPQ